MSAEQATTVRVETYRLASDTDCTDVGKNPQLVFGHLVRMAAPVMKSYWSDLYHDAMWLETHLAGRAFTFFYSFDESGTSIGTDSALATTREHRYRCEVHVTGGVTGLKVTNLR